MESEGERKQNIKENRLIKSFRSVISSFLFSRTKLLLLIQEKKSVFVCVDFLFVVKYY